MRYYMNGANLPPEVIQTIGYHADDDTRTRLRRTGRAAFMVPRHRPNVLLDTRLLSPKARGIIADNLIDPDGFISEEVMELITIEPWWKDLVWEALVRRLYFSDGNNAWISSAAEFIGGFQGAPHMRYFLDRVYQKYLDETRKYAGLPMPTNEAERSDIGDIQSALKNGTFEQYERLYYVLMRFTDYAQGSPLSYYEWEELWGEANSQRFIEQLRNGKWLYLQEADIGFSQEYTFDSAFSILTRRDDVEGVKLLLDWFDEIEGMLQQGKADLLNDILVGTSPSEEIKLIIQEWIKDRA